MGESTIPDRKWSLYARNNYFNWPLKNWAKYFLFQLIAWMELIPSNGKDGRFSPIPWHFKKDLLMKTKCIHNTWTAVLHTYCPSLLPMGIHSRILCGSKMREWKVILYILHKCILLSIYLKCIKYAILHTSKTTVAKPRPTDQIRCTDDTFPHVSGGVYCCALCVALCPAVEPIVIAAVHPKTMPQPAPSMWKSGCTTCWVASRQKCAGAHGSRNGQLPGRMVSSVWARDRVFSVQPPPIWRLLI